MPLGSRNTARTWTDRPRVNANGKQLDHFRAEIMPQVVQAYKVQATMSNAMLYEDDFFVCNVKSQVVVGTNYIITVSTNAKGCAEGKTADLKVFCPLPVNGGLCQLTEPVLLPPHFFSA